MSRRYDDSGDRRFDFNDGFEDNRPRRSRYDFENTSYDYGGDESEDINIYSSSASYNKRNNSQDSSEGEYYDDEYYEDEGYYDEDYVETYTKDGRKDVKRKTSARNSARSSSQRDRNVYSKKSKSSGKSRFLKFVAGLLAVLILLLGGYSLLCYSVIKDVDYEEYEDFDFEASADAEFDTLSSEDLYSKFYVKNIMLFGIDEDSSEYGRSDTMMLLSIDNLHRKLKLTSFQRDTFIHCPDPYGSYRTKLTNAFSYGGIPLAINTIETNFGIEIDAYATVNFESFKTIVDTLGGVTIELSEDEIGYINGQIYDNGQSEEYYIYEEAGPVTLNGQQALWYARNRGGTYGGVTYAGDDWMRTDRQRKFLSAVMDSMKEANPFELYSLIKSVTPYVTTDLSQRELTLMAMMSPLYLTYEMPETSMPSEGNWDYDQNFAGDIIYVTNWQGVREDLRAFVYND